MTVLILSVLGGLVAGSVPFGFLLAGLFGLGDVRRIGSGSIGATNVLRTGRKDVAALTLLLDGGKGAAAALLAGWWAGPVAALVAGVAAVVGHCFSPWMGFRGGKGIATGLGALFAWAWPVALACCAVWLAAAKLLKMSSASGMLAFIAAPLLMLAFRPEAMAIATLLVSLLVLVRHHANIRRILAGTEPRIGAGR